MLQRHKTQSFDTQVYADKGTVCFSAGLHGWGFTLTVFAKLYAKKVSKLSGLPASSSRHVTLARHVHSPTIIGYPDIRRYIHNRYMSRSSSSCCSLVLLRTR